MSAKSELDRYLESTPNPARFGRKPETTCPGGDSRNSIFWGPYPLFIESASGCHVMDADGTARLDFINTMTTMILGHGPAEVISAVAAQLERGLAYNGPSPQQVRLAQILCGRVPSFDLVRFTNSGTEATLNTLRAARAFTGKTRFAKVEGGYHGTHDAVSVSVRVDPSLAGEAERPIPVAASAGLGENVERDVVIVPFNQTEVAARILEEHREELAAVIVEPVLGSVGMLPAKEEFLAMLRKFTHDNGIVLIFDEVISFRVAPGGAQEYYGITPDLTSLGKIVGGGFPVGVFGGRKDIMDLYDPTQGPKVSHAGTFNANPVTMVAGSATLELLTPEVYRDLSQRTERLKEGIAEVCRETETPVVVTGLGSLFGIHFTAGPVNNYRDIAAGDSKLRDQVFLGLLNEGVLMAPNVVGSLSTAIGDREVEQFLEALRRVLARRG